MISRGKEGLSHRLGIGRLVFSLTGGSCTDNLLSYSRIRCRRTLELNPKAWIVLFLAAAAFLLRIVHSEHVILEVLAGIVPKSSRFFGLHDLRQPVLLCPTQLHCSLLCLCCFTPAGVGFGASVLEPLNLSPQRDCPARVCYSTVLSQNSL